MQRPPYAPPVGLHALPVFLSFDQFRNLTWKLWFRNIIPERPPTPAEQQMKSALDLSYRRKVQRNTAPGWGNISVTRHNAAVRRYDQLNKSMAEIDDKWYYDHAVKAGWIVPPNVEPNIRKELDDLVPDPENKAKELEKHGTMDPLKREKVNEDADLHALSVEDAALDYVENGLGRFYLKRHWAKHRDPLRVAEWLALHDYDVPVADVMIRLDSLAAGAPWSQ